MPGRVDMDNKSRPGRRPVRLLKQVHRAIRRKHYSYRTEMARLHWIGRFILFRARRALYVGPIKQSESGISLKAFP